jgi:dTDP-4-dehydrorhamnose 3,5-epimerase
MELTPLSLPGAFEVRLKPHIDPRGYFMRCYDRDVFERYGLNTRWVHANESVSVRRHTLRGLHFQVPPHTEVKLVRVVAGAAYDVLVDLRAGSPTFGRWEGLELTVETPRAVYIPAGFAHGFCSLTDHVIFQYLVDKPYAPDAQGGIRWSDPALGIAWPTREALLSPRDETLPLLAEFVSPFRFEGAGC